ncbi:Multidrug and toxin extrusion protein 2 [Lamellibrachia satsuma]|nr:Multidrug and toxin extrusion protein 2 [Lamellibrachia satsuma]
MLTLLPCYALHLNLESILILLGQDPDIARLAGEYLLIFMPGLFNVVVPLFIIGIVSLAVSVTLQYVLVFVVNWGIRGSAIAQDITYFVMCLLTILYMIFSRRFKETWDGTCLSVHRVSIWPKIIVSVAHQPCIHAVNWRNR